MSRFAAKTEVPVEKSRMEIETTVRRYGADGFQSGWNEEKASVQFRCKGRVVRFVMTLPRRDDKAFTTFTRGDGFVTHRRTPASAAALWEQACRQKWRALLLLVKANLEAVDAGIETFEEAFFANIVMPDGRTVYESHRAAVALAYEKSVETPLLGR